MKEILLDRLTLNSISILILAIVAWLIINMIKDLRKRIDELEEKEFKVRSIKFGYQDNKSNKRIKK